ncbi:MAG: PEP-CTERM sorting domain-containing protein [Verrucomicrobiae bacterium]|nr:PEP-CTERM sorting domain-containing protein [Verrucomicrobiae bacterium]NNJ87662.1 PEP-CTERM sorting domain-containing protein [Akkermansiaceae bacterium]
MLRLLLSAVLLSSALPVPAALLAYYSFDGQDGSDSSGNGLNGVGVSSPGYSSTELPSGITTSHSLALDGSGQRISVPHDPLLGFGGGQVTMSFWMKSGSSTSWLRVLSKNVGGAGFELQRNSNSSNGEIRVDTSSGTNQRTTVGTSFDGGWNHVVISLDNGDITAWTNGVKTTGTYSAGTGFSNSADLIIGTNQSGGNAFNGWIDDVALWDTTLSDSSAAALFAGASPLSIVPEPSTSLMLVGSVFMVVARRRR